MNKVEFMELVSKVLQETDTNYNPQLTQGHDTIVYWDMIAKVAVETILNSEGVIWEPQ